MTQEEKDLLIKDLCARLPYGVLCDFVYNIGHPQKLLSISPGEKYQIHLDSDEYVFGSGKSYGPSETIVDNIKPYLRPMSSMTDEEKEYVIHLAELPCAAQICEKKVDFFNSHHVDWRNLISKGLALEAPEDMYK
jgi:hypothetical protein